MILFLYIKKKHIKTDDYHVKELSTPHTNQIMPIQVVNT